MYTAQEDRIREKLRAYIETNFLYVVPDLILEDDDRLLERGVVDSMGIVEMLTFIEDEFGVKPEDEDISEANLGSVRAIVRFVASRQATITS